CALRAREGRPSARSGEGPARRETFAGPRRDLRAPRGVAAPPVTVGHRASGTASPRRAPARPRSPPRAPPDDAADRAGEDSPAWWTRPAPSAARDAPARLASG